MMVTKNKKIFILLVIFAVVTVSTVAVAIAVGSPTEESTVVSKGRSEIGRKNYILLGRDRVSGLCDVIMLASVDADGGNAAIMQIPRDTYAIYAENGYRKINGAPRVLGLDGFCSFISENMGLKIDGYASFDLDAFVEVVDALGGVNVDLPFSMDYDDPYQGLSIHLSEGKQCLDGREAEMFVRYRSGYIRGDLGRLDAQKIFVSAFISELRAVKDVKTVMKLVLLAADKIDTNIPLNDMWELVGVGMDISDENIVLMTLPGEDARPSENGAWFYIPSKSGANAALEKYFGAEGIFDPDERFVNRRYENFISVYDLNGDLKAPNLSDINENGLPIPKR